MNYGGNVIPAIIGKKNFAQYYVPNYNEAAQIVHQKGKLIGTHLDDNNETIMDEIAVGRSGLYRGVRSRVQPAAANRLCQVSRKSDLDQLAVRLALRNTRACGGAYAGDAFSA